MIIACDIDNCLNNLCEAVLSVYNEDADDKLEVKNITSYYIEEFVKPQYKKSFKYYFIDKRVWRRINLIKDCQKGLAELVRQGHQVIFLTSTEPENLKKKANWLQRNFPFIDIRKSLFCCPRKQYMSKIDILIDDAVQNIGDDYITILKAYPWNESYKVDNSKTFRANSWNEIVEQVKYIEKNNLCREQKCERRAAANRTNLKKENKK